MLELQYPEVLETLKAGELTEEVIKTIETAAAEVSAKFKS